MARFASLALVESWAFDVERWVFSALVTRSTHRESVATAG
jgi:hypothetical protein